MRYLITGITGFAGPHLANLLIKEGHDVFGLIRATNGREQDLRDVIPAENFNKLKFLVGDLIFPRHMDKIIKKHQFDGVFHLAAQSHPPISFANPRYTHDTNVNGTYNLLDSVINHSPDTDFMFCSTSEVYGVVPESKGLIDEGFPIKPMNPYGVSKACSDMHVRERAKSLNRNFFVTRAFSHTGPRRGNIFSISSDANQIVKIEKGYQDKIIEVGTLSSKRVVMDVRDCVKAYYLLMHKAEPGEAYNVGGDDAYTMGELLDKMLNITGLDVEKKVNPDFVRPIDIPVQICDTTKCRTLTGWKPEYKIDRILNDLLDYWRKKIE